MRSLCYENQFSLILKLELITKVSHLDLLWKRDWGELGNGLLLFNLKRYLIFQNFIHPGNQTPSKHVGPSLHFHFANEIYLCCLSRTSLTWYKDNLNKQNQYCLFVSINLRVPDRFLRQGLYREQVYNGSSLHSWYSTCQLTKSFFSFRELARYKLYSLQEDKHI